MIECCIVCLSFLFIQSTNAKEKQKAIEEAMSKGAEVKNLRLPIKA